MDADFWQSSVQWLSLSIFLLIMVAVVVLVRIDLANTGTKKSGNRKR